MSAPRPPFLNSAWTAPGSEGPALELTPVNGFATTHDGQRIHGLDIWCDNSPMVIQHAVHMSHCRIRFRGRLGMFVFPGADRSVFSFLDIAHASPPLDLSTFPSPPDATTLDELKESQLPPPAGIGGYSYEVVQPGWPGNIPFEAMQMGLQANGCDRLKFHGMRFTNCSMGIKLVGCTNAKLTRIYVDRARGPFYTGASVQFAEGSNDGLLQDFHFYNPIDDSFTEDSLSIYHSHRITVRRGLIEGNNAPLGVGVMCETAQNCLIEDVDCVDMGNGAFSSYAWYRLTPETPDPGIEGYGHSNVFRRCRARDMHWRSARNIPASGMMFHAYKGDASTTYGIRFEDCKYKNPSPEAGISPGEPDSSIIIPGVLIAEDGALEYYNITEEDFTPRTVDPIVFPWDDYTGGPFMVALNIGPGQYRPIVDEDIAIGTDVGILRAESNDPDETFTFSFSETFSDFTIYDGNKVKTNSALLWDDGTRYLDASGDRCAAMLPIRATGSRGNHMDKDVPVDLLPIYPLGAGTTSGAVVGVIRTAAGATGSGALPSGWSEVTDLGMALEVDALEDIFPFETISFKMTGTRPSTGAFPRVVATRIFYPNGIGGSGPAADGDVWRIRVDMARKAGEPWTLFDSGVSLVEYNGMSEVGDPHIFGLGLGFESPDLRSQYARIGGDVTLNQGPTVNAVAGLFYFSFKWEESESSAPKSQTIMIGSPRLVKLS